MKVFLRLAKVPLCLLIGFSTLFGYLYALPLIDLHAFLPTVAVFLLAAGGATFNSIQERTHDGRMTRTCNRPLVTGEVSVATARLFGAACCGAGFFLLLSLPTYTPAILGGAALILYNGVYTPMKQVSIWAMVPGAVCGAFPPLIGMTAAGSKLFSFPALLVFTLIVLWQVPHFWLVMLAYKKDYISARLPNFFHLFSEVQLKRFFVTWIGGLAVTMLIFTVVPANLHSVARILILVNSLCTLMFFVLMPGNRSEKDYRKLFIGLNLFFFVHMVLVILGRLLG